MPNQVTGRLTTIGQTVQIPSKTGGEPFVKREFLLDATTHDPYTGERSQYENILPLEVSGDKCAELDQFRVGDVITVSFALQGREWTNQDGQVKVWYPFAVTSLKQGNLYSNSSRFNMFSRQQRNRLAKFHHNNSLHKWMQTGILKTTCHSDSL